MRDAAGRAAEVATAGAVESERGLTPIGWQTRFDATTVQPGDMHPVGGNASFVQMTPGFHVTTGPAGIYWHPDSTATGTFAVQSSIFICPTGGRDREGYGMFVGGQELRGAGQRYTYFLLRNDGRFLIKQRSGDRTTTLADWTPLAAIKLATDKDAMQTDLRVEVGAESVVFSVNGTTEATVPRAQVLPDGVYGLRINHAVNAHVTKVARVP